MIQTARAQVGAYPTVVFIDGVAADAWKEDDCLMVALENGEVHTSAKLLLAFGVSDVLPEIPGSGTMGPIGDPLSLLPWL
jgi:thioredoxin reductase